jgi:hypothetical protein
MMSVGMSPNIDEPQLPWQAAITGDGTADLQAPVSAGDVPAVIAVRLRWHRPFGKDRSLDYNETQLTAGSGLVHLTVRYELSPGERKTAFVEIINKKNGQKLKSNRVVFEGQPNVF